jgi:hypothetical protein
MVTGNALKSPLRMAIVGIDVKTWGVSRRSRYPSYAMKKNIRFRRTGPPRVAPYSCWLSDGLTVAKNAFESSALLRKYSNTLP